MTTAFIQTNLFESLHSPEVEPTRKQLATMADCTVRTIDADVAMLNRLVPKEFKYIEGQQIFTHEQKKAILGVRRLFRKYRLRTQVELEIIRKGLPQ